MRLMALLLVLMATPGWAQLMPAQTGTVRFVADKAYVALGVPVAMLMGTPSETTEQVSVDAFYRASADLQMRLHDAIALRCNGALLTLLDLRMQPEVHSESSLERVPQVTVMAIFSTPEAQCDFQFATSLVELGQKVAGYDIRVTADTGYEAQYRLTQALPFFDFRLVP